METIAAANKMATCIKAIEFSVKEARSHAYEAGNAVSRAAVLAVGVDAAQVARLREAERLIDDARSILFELQGNIRASGK